MLVLRGRVAACTHGNYLTHAFSALLFPPTLRSAVQLGSDLTLMMLIEVDPSRSAALHSALAEHQRTLRDVHLITRISEPLPAAAPAALAHAVGAPPAPPPPRSARFHMAAIDRPGLVHIVTSAWRPRAGVRVWACVVVWLAKRAVCLTRVLAPPFPQSFWRRMVWM